MRISLCRNPITHCDIAFKRVARLDNCPSTSFKDTNTNNGLQTGPLDGVGGLFNSITNSLGISSPTYNQTKVSTLNIKKGVVKSREKRIAPIIAIVGIIVVAGMEVYTSYQMETNINNIKQLTIAANEERERVIETRICGPEGSKRHNP